MRITKKLTVKDAVREVLEESPRARNSDTILILLTLRKFGVRIYIQDLKNIPSMESITRSRRFWQNQKGLYTPTEDIDTHRNKRELEFKHRYT